VNGLAEMLRTSSEWLAPLALLVGIIALLWLAALQRRVRTVTPDVRRLVRDMEGKSIEQVVQHLLGNTEFVGSRLGRLQVTTDGLQRSLTGAIQRRGLVRYNADRTMGGELSFSLALLDGDRSGVLLTCLHTLDDCRLYVRNVERGACAHDLSDEEAEALETALQRSGPAPERTRRVRRTRWRAQEQARLSRSEPTTERGETDAE
jgi:hypothetical protein